MSVGSLHGLPIARPIGLGWLAPAVAISDRSTRSSIQPKADGAILALVPTRSDLEARLSADPFVAEGVVKAEILEIIPSRADPRLAFLLP